MEKSLRVAIVDDLTEDSQRLADYLEQFQREHNMEIKMDVYNASFEFLEKYHGNYDVIFLDIEMPAWRLPEKSEPRMKLLESSLSPEWRNMQWMAMPSTPLISL